MNNVYVYDAGESPEFHYLTNVMHLSGEDGQFLKLLGPLPDGKPPAPSPTTPLPRHQHRNLLSLVANIVRTCLPRAENITVIQNARIPIVHFYHNLLDVNCDISLYNEYGSFRNATRFAILHFRRVIIKLKVVN